MNGVTTSLYHSSQSTSKIEQGADLFALLPDEVIQNIFSYLSAKDLSSVCLVSKKWEANGVASLKQHQCEFLRRCIKQYLNENIGVKDSAIGVQLESFQTSLYENYFKNIENLSQAFSHFRNLQEKMESLLRKLPLEQIKVSAAVLNQSLITQVFRGQGVCADILEMDRTFNWIIPVCSLEQKLSNCGMLAAYLNTELALRFFNELVDFNGDLNEANRAIETFRASKQHEIRKYEDWGFFKIHKNWNTNRRIDFARILFVEVIIPEIVYWLFEAGATLQQLEQFVSLVNKYNGYFYEQIALLLLKEKRIEDFISWCFSQNNQNYLTNRLIQYCVLKCSNEDDDTLGKMLNAASSKNASCYHYVLDELCKIFIANLEISDLSLQCIKNTFIKASQHESELLTTIQRSLEHNRISIRCYYRLLETIPSEKGIERLKSMFQNYVFYVDPRLNLSRGRLSILSNPTWRKKLDLTNSK